MSRLMPSLGQRSKIGSSFIVFHRRPLTQLARDGGRTEARSRGAGSVSSALGLTRSVRSARPRSRAGSIPGIRAASGLARCWMRWAPVEGQAPARRPGLRSANVHAKHLRCPGRQPSPGISFPKRAKEGGLWSDPVSRPIMIGSHVSSVRSGYSPRETVNRRAVFINKFTTITI